MNTKDRILDTAEKLFAEQGYAGTSLRQIISAAGVNLAAVHYHFKSKDALLDAGVLRRARPVNEARLKLLEQAEEAGTANTENVLRAFLEPTFSIALQSRYFIRLMGRLHAEGGILPGLFARHFGPLAQRFAGALARSLPEIPQPELFWRIHFALGAMAHTLLGSLELEAVSGGICGPEPGTVTMDRLIAFLAAGLRAPLPAARKEAECGTFVEIS